MSVCERRGRRGPGALCGTSGRQACVNHRSLEGWPLLTLAATPAANAARLVGAMSAVIMDVGACEQLAVSTPPSATPILATPPINLRETL